MFNALGKPLHASLVIILHLFVFVLPLAYLGSKCLRVEGDLCRYRRWKCGGRDHRLSDAAEIPCAH